jgi:nucleoside-diphosphate-sugar epimerase
VVWASPTDPSALPSGPFDVVYDNNGKDLEACRPLIDHFKGRVKHYVFVGSAGAYAANAVEPMHVEGDPRKASAGHVAVEAYLEEQGLPYTVFQPLYIYGAHTAKDCEQWFMDRVMRCARRRRGPVPAGGETRRAPCRTRRHPCWRRVLTCLPPQPATSLGRRDRPVPIPSPGLQLTTLSHVDDVASMLAAVPGHPGAVGQHFNVCSDRCISFDGIARAVAKAAGKEARIVHYDPKAVALPKGAGFPFRCGTSGTSAARRGAARQGGRVRCALRQDGRCRVLEGGSNGAALPPGGVRVAAARTPALPLTRSPAHPLPAACRAQDGAFLRVLGQGQARAGVAPAARLPG